MINSRKGGPQGLPFCLHGAGLTICNLGANMLTLPRPLAGWGHIGSNARGSRYASFNRSAYVVGMLPRPLYDSDMAAIEISRSYREALARLVAIRSSQQLGEAFQQTEETQCSKRT